jgi:hypothetical protein
MSKIVQLISWEYVAASSHSIIKQISRSEVAYPPPPHINEKRDNNKKQ